MHTLIKRRGLTFYLPFPRSETFSGAPSRQMASFPASWTPLPETHCRRVRLPKCAPRIGTYRPTTYFAC